MDYHAIQLNNDSLSHTVRVFLLGMAVAFGISLIVSVAQTDSSTVSAYSSVDCNDPISVAKAIDQSRNGLLTGC